jgi:hypothetical protein
MGGPHLVAAHRVAKTLVMRRPPRAVWRCERDCNAFLRRFDERDQNHVKLVVCRTTNSPSRPQFRWSDNSCCESLPRSFAMVVAARDENV